MRDLVQTALDRRQPLPDDQTDAFRVFDGAGDGLDGLEIDAFAGRWLVSTRGDSIPTEMRDALLETGRTIYHKRLDQHQKESPIHVTGPECTEPFTIRENGLSFEVSFSSGYSQGIFLDQRSNRRWLIEQTQADARVLNTFAYTGAFSVAAASVGAITTTLDLSQPYLDWARRNLELNAIDPSDHYFCKGDTFHWLRRFAKQGRRFDTIILDPPTFSRDQDGKVFRVETDYGHLAALAERCLADTGTILACTNCRQLTETTFRNQLLDSLPRDFLIESVPMPPDFTGEPYLKTLRLRR
ncbi:class I SAM-dependent rRNA methyltransferase [Haloferula sp. A504]|uniref:class I SAM-dependent rRNA methyltransferase n=1 Tax=Haloferula sp. A504 TaxID=3373601 RepID=UPI0031C98AF9|nr:class I SAM-dependent methyltransferase [Verrucomicrobiaceae bacterium E54]